MKIICSVLLVATLSGCGVEVDEIAEEDRNRIIECVDTRDGEKFSYNTNSITDIHRGFSDYSFNFVDSEGATRHASTQLDQFMKCKKY